MSYRVVVPVESLEFPFACVSCSGEAQSYENIESWTGLDIWILRFGWRLPVQIPVCDRCWARRRWWHFRAPLLAIGGVAALAFPLLAAYFPAGRKTPWALLLVLAVVIGLGVYSRILSRPLDRYLDRKLLGVWSPGFSRLKDTVTLKFENHTQGREFEARASRGTE